jgi:hypothetical protein
MNHPVTAQAMHDAARATQECEAICIDTIQYCLQQGGAHVESSHMKLVLECAEICTTTVKFLLLGAFHGQVSGVCANICEACAVSCEKFAGDSQMKEWADSCRLCAAACRRVATA